MWCCSCADPLNAGCGAVQTPDAGESERVRVLAVLGVLDAVGQADIATGAVPLGGNTVVDQNIESGVPHVAVARTLGADNATGDATHDVLLDVGGLLPALCWYLQYVAYPARCQAF